MLLMADKCPHGENLIHGKRKSNTIRESTTAKGVATLMEDGERITIRTSTRGEPCGTPHTFRNCRTWKATRDTHPPCGGHELPRNRPHHWRQFWHHQLCETSPRANAADTAAVHSPPHTTQEEEYPSFPSAYGSRPLALAQWSESIIIATEALTLKGDGALFKQSTSIYRCRREKFSLRA